MSLIWKPPSIPGACWFAEWNGRTFALVREMPDGTWRAAVFPKAQLVYHPVTKAVGSPRNKGEEMVEPITL